MSKHPRRHGALAALAGLLLALGLFGSATAAPSANSGQCPGATDPANEKHDTSDGSFVLDAGLSVCIHAGGGNTGIFITDGTSTLADYILASGLLNNGGQVPNVSNYVIYPTTPSAPPSEEPSAPPSDEPSAPPSEEPTPEPSGPDSGGGEPGVTPPPSDTVAPATEQPDQRPLALLVLAATAGTLITLRRLQQPR